MRQALIAFSGLLPRQIWSVVLTVRWVLWFVYGHLYTLAVLVCTQILGYGHFFVVFLMAEAAWFIAGLVFPAFNVWTKAARFRRRFPGVHASIVHRPSVVDANAPSLNSAKSEPIFLRPLFATPLLSPVPLIKGQTASWKILAPSAGKTLPDLALIAENIAASTMSITNIEVRFRKGVDSSGTLIAQFGDPLATIRKPKWITNNNSMEVQV